MTGPVNASMSSHKVFWGRVSYEGLHIISRTSTHVFFKTIETVEGIGGTENCYGLEALAVKTIGSGGLCRNTFSPMVRWNLIATSPVSREPRPVGESVRPRGWPPEKGIACVVDGDCEEVGS